MAGDAVVGEEVGRVGEDEVDAGCGDGGEDVEAVALEDFDVVLGVLEGGVGEGPAFAEASARQIPPSPRLRRDWAGAAAAGVALWTAAWVSAVGAARCGVDLGTVSGVLMIKWDR